MLRERGTENGLSNPAFGGFQTVRQHGRRRALARLSAMMLLVVFFGGCTSWREYVQNGFKVGPNYCKPAAPVADDWIEAKSPEVSTSPAEDAAWWQNLHDPALDSLMHLAYQQNLNVRTAGARILEARAQRNIAAGSLFPQTQNINGGYTRTNLSQNSPLSAGAPITYDEWRVGPNLSWELDFWGRYRRAVEAADARLDATVEEYDNVLVLMVAEVAQRYVDVRTAEQRLDYAQQNVTIQRESLKLAKVKFENGATTKLDVTQGESSLGQTEATIPPLESNRRQAANQLCILLGMPPRDIDDLLTGRKPIPSVAPNVALGIPADLLRRRPDIRRAERNVAAQSAMIGYATSDLYPHFSITGSMYVDAEKFNDLFNANSFGGNVGPAFNWNVLNYGRLVNGIRVEDARFQALVFTYQQAVLQANGEVENSLIGFLNSQRQAKFLADAAEAAKQSVQLVRSQYDAGKTDFNRVLTVEQQLTQQEDALAVAQGQVVQSLVSVYKALGGGWQIRLENVATTEAAAVPKRLPDTVPMPQPAPTVPTPPQAPAAAAPVKS
jgi:NodT family efflux transporter outer membrane factor (OMF) lipoprotein